MATDNNIDPIPFQVDAGLIDRLGKELVGRAETAVSELVKNAYDADATSVDVEFINSNEIGGTLIIKDNGIGMTLDQLKSGFMTISSTDKIHNPKSIRFERSKAGRKGIGRFATQRLGEKLTIITQTKEATKALKISIDWNSYKIDINISAILNPVEEIDKVQEEGTILIIDNLREWWSEKSIERIYRYVSDLLQPDYLSDRSRQLGLAKQKDESFKVRFLQNIYNVEKLIADPNKMLFNKALAVIEGYVDSVGDGFVSVTSDSFDIGDDIIEIKNSESVPKFLELKDVHFKAYYFIYNRSEYYTNISRLELSNIQKISQEQGGIKLYRNGFRVLPYGEPLNDWLTLDRRYYDESGVTNIPFANPNLFGFVEVIDQTGDTFQETASREGLIENQAYDELREFVYKSLEAAKNRLRYFVDKKKKERTKLQSVIEFDNNEPEKSTIQKLEDLEKLFENPDSEKNTEEYKLAIKRVVSSLKFDFQNIIDELGMLRVLAGLGLTIGEFTHEVVQFSPSMNGDLSVLGSQKLDLEGVNALNNLRKTIKLFTSYTSYFNATVSANVSRELKPQDLNIVVTHFTDIIEADIKKLNIALDVKFYGYDLISVPMHSSEWSSILFNLYTNSKKAIRRANVEGKISIVGGREDGKIYLEFSDNGDGIPEENKERIFDAFFTTSSPVGFGAPQDERLTGTGLGLKIVRDIIQTYRGSIQVISPENNYSTCIRIEIPLANQKQKDEAI